MTRRSGLGRGLGALIPSEPERPDGDFLREVDLTQIVPNRYQPRAHFDEEALTSLAESIAAVGVIQPIVVREISQGYEILAGERRWRAAQRAGLTQIPVLVKPAEDRGALEIAVVENLHRQDLNALEEAAAYRQLIDDFGVSQRDVAVRVGRSRSAVANTIRLLNLPAGIQRLMVEGHLSAGHGRALLSVAGDESRERLAEEVVREGLTVRDTERRVAELSELEADAAGTPGDSPQAPDEGAEHSPATLAGLLELEHLLAERLDTKVSVNLRRGAGRITIKFADLEDLERIYNVITPSVM